MESFIRPTSSGHQASGNFSLLSLLSKWKIVRTFSSLKKFCLRYSEVLLELHFFNWVLPDTFIAIVLKDSVVSWLLMLNPHLLLGDAKFLVDFSAISACLTSSFHELALTVPCELPLCRESYTYMFELT